jgi:hypothetical protein
VNDTLRFRWTTETELDNQGFDLFAVEPGGGEWLLLNESRIAPQGLGIESQEYYYQVDRPGLAADAEFYLRAYDKNGTHEDFGPVQAVYTTSIMRPIAPAPPVERPIVEPRSEPVPLRELGRSEQPIVPPARPIVEPEDPIAPGPVMPRLDRELRPGPIMGRHY